MIVKPDPRLFDMTTAPDARPDTSHVAAATSAAATQPDTPANKTTVPRTKKRKYTWRTTREQQTKIVFWVGQNVDKLTGKTLVQVESVLKSHFALVPSRKNISQIMADCGVTLAATKGATRVADGSYCTKLHAFRTSYRIGVAGVEVTEALATIVDTLNGNNCLTSETATLVAEKLYRAYTLYVAMQRRRLVTPSNELLRLHWEAAGGDTQQLTLRDYDDEAASVAE